MTSQASLPARVLCALRPWIDAPGWHVGFSGGLDSTVLLHVLASLRQAHRLPPLVAIHVHHGLQSVADGWPDHCRRVCQSLGIAFELRHVRVGPGASVEAAARQARYTALGAALGEDEVLLTAQHQDDQAETLLFRLLRGAGVKGLAGMPECRPLGLGFLVRPLLDISRQHLESYARAHGLTWVEDPSNLDQAISRNYLRATVIPALVSRWPGARTSMARAATHLREAQQLLDELAQSDLAALSPATRFDWLPLPSLELAALGALSAARQRNLLRYWLAEHGALPDTAHWRGWEQLRDAAADAAPRWRLAEGELVRGEGRVWFLPKSWARPPLPVTLPWGDPAQALPLSDNGSLRLEGQTPPGALQVRYRQGGERMRLDGRGERDLKRLLNEAGVPVFLRPRLPLLYRDDRLWAVANLPSLWPPGLSLVWKPPGLR